MTVDLTSLNENQLDAVKWQDGPLLVLAGPGSGKTRVLTYRIARLVEESPDKRYRILGLTFTNKAAAEMRERIISLVPNASERFLLTTFHSFCAELLRQHGHHLGLRPDFTILGQQADREAVLDDTLSKTEAHHYRAEQIMPLINRLLDYNVSPENTLETLNSSNVSDAEKLAEIYATYRTTLIEQNSLDFGALISETITLLEDFPGIRKQIHKVYSYVCVDEFQDTNYSQYLILRRLINPKTNNLFVVADDDQIIYQWNGASPERLDELKKEFEMEVIQLPENYRCPPAVIDMANRLIVNNLGRTAGKEALKAHKSLGDNHPVRLAPFSTVEEEAQWVAQDISSRPQSERKGSVILGRTRKILDYFINSLGEIGIDAYISMRKDEFSSPQMSWLHAMLRLANSRQDKEQLRKICKSFYSLEGINLEVRDIISFAATETGDYLRAWCSTVLNHSNISSETKAFIEKYGFGLCDRLDYDAFIKEAFSWFENLDDMQIEFETGGANDFSEEKEVWVELTSEINKLFGKENVTLHSLLQELDMRSKTPAPPADAIPCFTIHASKGLEFDHVYLVGMVDDQLPSWAAKKKGDDSKEMQEERRNCFVAITRAQETLTLTYSQQMFGYSKAPSRFLYEMGLIT